MWNLQVLLPKQIKETYFMDDIEAWAIDFECSLKAEHELNAELIKRIFLGYRPVISKQVDWRFDLCIALIDNWYSLEISIWRSVPKEPSKGMSWDNLKQVKVAVLIIKIQKTKEISYVDYLEV